MNKTKIAVFAALIAVTATGVFMTGYSFAAYQQKQLAAEPPAHTHQWSSWGDPVSNGSSQIEAVYIQFRHCTNCGVAEFRPVEKLE